MADFSGREIGLGVIGLGMGGSVFVAHDHPDLCGFRVKAICDTNEQRLAGTAKGRKVDIATTDWRELVRRPEVDVVGVYTPDPLHAEHVMGALEAGKPVIVTKPFVTRLDDAVRILKETRKRNLPLIIGQTCRFIRSYQVARRLVQEGEYGRLLYVEATYNHDLRDVFNATPWRYQMPQDFLFGGLCHPLDLAFWVGGRIKRVCAFAQESRMDERYPKGYFENYVANLEFENGALGRVIGLYMFVHDPGLSYIDLNISGSRGASCLPFNRPIEEQQITIQEAGKRTREPMGRYLKDEHGGTAGSHNGEVLSYLRHFEDCLRTGATPSPGALDGVRVIAALEAIRESARTGRAVDVPWDF